MALLFAIGCKPSQPPVPVGFDGTGLDQGSLSSADSVDANSGVDISVDLVGNSVDVQDVSVAAEVTVAVDLACLGASNTAVCAGPCASKGTCTAGVCVVDAVEPSFDVTIVVKTSEAFPWKYSFPPNVAVSKLAANGARIVAWTTELDFGNDPPTFHAARISWTGCVDWKKEFFFPSTAKSAWSINAMEGDGVDFVDDRRPYEDMKIYRVQQDGSIFKFSVPLFEWAGWNDTYFCEKWWWDDCGVNGVFFGGHFFSLLMSKGKVCSGLGVAIQPNGQQTELFNQDSGTPDQGFCRPGGGFYVLKSAGFGEYSLKAIAAHGLNGAKLWEVTKPFGKIVGVGDEGILVANQSAPDSGYKSLTNVAPTGVATVIPVPLDLGDGKELAWLAPKQSGMFVMLHLKQYVSGGPYNGVQRIDAAGQPMWYRQFGPGAIGYYHPRFVVDDVWSNYWHPRHKRPVLPNGGFDIVTREVVTEKTTESWVVHLIRLDSKGRIGGLPDLCAGIKAPGACDDGDAKTVDWCEQTKGCQHEVW